MEQIKTENIFTILVHLLDETAEKNSTLKDLNEIQLMVDEKLIPTIEKIQYENKYELIDRIHDICRDISLYLHFPEMIDKVLVGFHNPDTLSFCGCTIFDTLPTIIHGNPKQEYQGIRGLNFSEKTVSISNQEYSELFIHLNEKEIDLAGILYNISIYSQEINNNQMYIVIPKRTDTSKKYYRSLMRAVDILVISAKECFENVLREYENISQIMMYGRMTSGENLKLENYCKENEISIKYFDSLSEIFEKLQKNDYIEKKNNLCYVYYLENILYEISWYLATAKSESESPLADINDNLLYNDDEKSHKCIKELQKRYSDKIEFITKLYNNYKNKCDELIEKIRSLQNNFEVRENGDCINRHINMKKVLLELALKLSETYKSFPEMGSKEKMRKYCDMYRKISGNIQVSNVILNDFFGNDQSQDDLKAFYGTQVDSMFFKRKKIDIKEKLHLQTYECVDIILSLEAPLRSVEKRILGEYYLNKNEKEKSKQYLKEAMEEGDQKASELFVKNIEISESELKQIADYGVKTAAYKLGRDLYSKGNIFDCIKYLNIAASQKYLEAIKLLGDISYEKYSEESNMQEASKALHYYLIAEKKGDTDLKMYEKIGEMYFEQKNYLKSKEYCQKSDTAKSNYLLGVIFEKGYGCATDKKSALKYYFNAKEEGHYEAEISYARLTSEIEEKIRASEKGKIFDENKSYSSSTRIENYHSDGGW